MRFRKKRIIVLSLCVILVWLFIILITPAPKGSERFAQQRKGLWDSLTPSPKTDARKNIGIQSNNSHFKHKDLDSIEKDELSKNIIVTRRNTSLVVSQLQLENDLLVKNLPKLARDYLNLWRTAASWVNSSQIYPVSAPSLGTVLHMMSHGRILKADVGYKGTQLKARLTLDGGQMVVFKPKWYTRDEILTGTPYSGKDRHNGEIAAFHLDRMLGFRRAPLVVGRRINLQTEILPVATQRLKDTFITEDNNTCFYGVCYYCRPTDAACADGAIMEGSLTLWLPIKFELRRWRHPWARTYRKDKLARWETDDTYCKDVMKSYPLDRRRLVLDVVDTAVFDYLIGNADRHMYETFTMDDDNGMLLLMDNGKSFGNPYWDEKSILAPLTQCCRMRRTTWLMLQMYSDDKLSQVLRKVLSHDPIAPVLNQLNLAALDRRLIDIFDVVNQCISSNGEETVFVQ